MKSKNNHYHNLDHSSFLSELGTTSFKNNIPLFTTIELTQDCNLRCSHCYNFDRTQVKRDYSGTPLTLKQWKEVITQVMDAGAFYICFTGGEVLLYQGLWELVDEVTRRHGLVKLKSNGATLTPDNVKKIIKHKINNVEISLYGMSEESYSRFTNKSQMFDKVIRGIQQLKENERGIVLNFILHRYNVHEIPDMIKFAEEMNIPFNISDEITKRYDETDSSLDLNITEDQYQKLLAGPFGDLFSIKHDLSNHSFQCACARNVCGIGYNGDIFPCIGAPIKVGNILWENFKSVWTDAPFFKKLRGVKNEDFKECTKCDVAQFCNRSSGSTYVNTKDYFGCDPVSLKLAKLRKHHMGK